MKKNPSSQSGFFAPRFFVASILCAFGISFVVFGIAAPTPKKISTAAATAIRVNNPGAVVPVISPALRDLPTVNQVVSTHTDLGDIEHLAWYVVDCLCKLVKLLADFLQQWGKE